MDDRARYLRTRLDAIRRQLRRPCSGDLFCALLSERAGLTAELVAERQRRPRRAWKSPPPQRQRVRRQRQVWMGARPGGYGRDNGWR